MRSAHAPAAAALAAAVLLLAVCGGSASKPGQEGPGPPRETQAIEEGDPTARTVEVAALAVSQGPDGYTGEAIADRITVGPSETGEMKVSFAETEVSGIGPSLSASGWTAVALASLLLGIDPRQYEFKFEPEGGYVDGNSSSGLYTVGVLAAILGEDIDPDTAMTAGINPDGTIGPVGGIPQKIKGAAEAGKKAVIIPAMQRFDADLNTGESVDLVELGASLGLEVKPVSTVYEAYEILTGSELPQPSAMGTPQMPGNAFGKLKAATTEWLGRYEAAVNRFLALPETLGLEDDIFVATQYAAAANSSLELGLAAVAYERASTAASLAEGALQAVTLAEAYVNSGIEGLVEEVQALPSAETRLAATLQRLESEPPRSATDLLALTDAYSNAAIAFGLASDAGALLQFPQETEMTEDEALGLILSIARDYAKADSYLNAAENNLVYGFGLGESPPPEPEAVRAIAETVRRAADANLALIDGLILEREAEAAGVTADAVRKSFVSNDANYGAALGAVASTAYFRNTIKEETQASVAMLGSGLLAWGESAAVLAKYYSLDAQLDEGFNVVGFGRERALSDMLELADERAANVISLVADEEPVSALYYHENAASYREGTAQDKVTSLFYNWQAAVFGEALAYFTGTFDSAISEAGASPLWEWGAASVAPAGAGASEDGETTPTSTPTPD
ncbi:MAG: S16 family serine protease [Dehalococcoidia bacterium]|nr:S16 family serine protease [Dehalococcoidia bacterium]